MKIISMPGGEEEILAPLREGYFAYRDLVDGAIDLSDIVRINAYRHEIRANDEALRAFWERQGGRS